MTTPHDRCTALIDMLELLTQMRHDIEHVPDKLREEIVIIKRHLPGENELKRIARHVTGA